MRVSNLFLLQASPSHSLLKSNTSPHPSPAASDVRDSPNTGFNPIGSLQEMCMKNNWTPPSYDIVHETGESHTKIFIYECKVRKL